MKIEILATNGIKGAFRELDIDATRTYKGTDEPRLEVWEIEKSDLRKLEEAPEWNHGWGQWAYSTGSRTGTACDFFTVNNEFLIGLGVDSGNDTYEKLTDYLYDGLGAKSHIDVYNFVICLAKANGKTLTDLFKTFQG